MDRIEFLRNKRNDLYQNYKKELNEIQNELDKLIFKKNNIENLKDKYICYKHFYLKVKNITRITNGIKLSGYSFENDEDNFNIYLNDVLILYYDDYKYLKIISEYEFFNTLHKVYTEKWECIQN